MESKKQNRKTKQNENKLIDKENKLVGCQRGGQVVVEVKYVEGIKRYKPPAIK